MSCASGLNVKPKSGVQVGLRYWSSLIDVGVFFVGCEDIDCHIYNVTIHFRGQFKFIALIRPHFLVCG
jgi:hypothetical protein